MSRLIVVILTAVVVVGALGVFPAAGVTRASLSDDHIQYAVQETDENETDGNASAIAPGEQLSGVLGVHRAEIEGEVEKRTFGIRIAKAATAKTKANVVKGQLGSIEHRLTQLEQRKQELRQTHKNGSISEGRFRAEMAQLAARTKTVKQLTIEAETQAKNLPRDTLENKGINVTAIQLLKRNAEDLSGPEVAEITRSIAGPDIGAPPGGPPGQAGRPDERGPSAGEAGIDEAERAIDRAERRVNQARERVEQARDRVDQMNGSEDAIEALTDAEKQLQKAEQALQDARAAFDGGNHNEAVELATQAADLATQAERNAQDALTTARQQGRESGQNGNQGQDNGHGDDGGQGSNNDRRRG